MREYRPQPFKVAILVLLLIFVGMAGSYMLYNRPAAVKNVTSATAAAPNWQTYALHGSALSFRYPAEWSVSESATVTPTAYIFSPTGKTTLTIASNTPASAARTPGTIIASEPARLLGTSYYWDYIQEYTPTGSASDGDTILALLTATDGNAAWPLMAPASSSDATMRLQITIQDHDGRNDLNRLQHDEDVATAKLIVQSLHITGTALAQ